MISEKQKNSNKIIYLRNAGKKFVMGRDKRQGALAHFLAGFSKKDRSNFWALRDLNFDLEKGGIFGFIGRNGSGKSTLLRLLAGVYQLDEGEMKIEGETLYLTGFGQGVASRLSARDNIYLTGALLGLSPKEIKDRFDKIIDFAELHDYVDTQIYKFSSGMMSRLSFATTIFCLHDRQPDILLIDEALDAGADFSFQQKAGAKMEELIKGGATVLLVSHNLLTIEKYCQKVFWLEKGKIIKSGSPTEIIAEYENTGRKK